MSKIDELKQVYDAAEDAAQCVSIPGESFIYMMHRAQLAGIAAVVRALRDEMHAHPGECWACEDNRNKFNEILGAAGDEVADTVAQVVEPLEVREVTGASPVRAATDPAPSVCVWTDVGDAYRSACGRSHFAWTSRDGVVVCPHCKALIKFTEAKT